MKKIIKLLFTIVVILCAVSCKQSKNTDTSDTGIWEVNNYTPNTWGALQDELPFIKSSPINGIISILDVYVTKEYEDNDAKLYFHVESNFNKGKKDIPIFVLTPRLINTNGKDKVPIIWESSNKFELSFVNDKGKELTFETRMKSNLDWNTPNSFVISGQQATELKELLSESKNITVSGKMMDYETEYLKSKGMDPSTTWSTFNFTFNPNGFGNAWKQYLKQVDRMKKE